MSEERISCPEVNKALDALIEKGLAKPSPLKPVVPKPAAIPPEPKAVAVEAEPPPLPPAPEPESAPVVEPKPPDPGLSPIVSERLWDESHVDARSLRPPPPPPRGRRIASFPPVKKTGPKVPPISDDPAVGIGTGRQHGNWLDWNKRNEPNGNAPKMVEHHANPNRVQVPTEILVTIPGGSLKLGEMFGGLVTAEPIVRHLLDRLGGPLKTDIVGNITLSSKGQLPGDVMKRMELLKQKPARIVAFGVILREAKQAGLVEEGKPYVSAIEEVRANGRDSLVKATFHGEVLHLDTITVEEFVSGDFVCVAVRNRLG